MVKSILVPWVAKTILVPFLAKTILVPLMAKTILVPLVAKIILISLMAIMILKPILSESFLLRMNFLILVHEAHDSNIWQLFEANFNGNCRRDLQMALV